MSLHETETPSLSRALGQVNIVGIAVALLISSVVLLVYQAASLRASLTEIARIQAAMVSENISAALMFRDSDAANEILRHLSSLPYVESVAIFDKKDLRFVRYTRQGLSVAQLNEATLRAASQETQLSFEDVIVSKPIELNGETLGTVVLVATTERMEMEFGRYAAFLFAASAGAVWIARFVMSRMKARLDDAERQLEHLARTDPLTNLPNRRAFYEALAHRLQPPAGPNAQVTLVLIDLDDFKTINDTLGHGAGDELLLSVALTLQQSVHREDIVSRIGGDEFAVLATGHRELKHSQSTAETIIRALGRPVQLHGRIVPVTASVGFSRFPDDAKDVASLVSSADIALYAAKSRGKNIAVAFRREMTIEAQRRARLEHDLREAIDNDRLDVAYQPQFNCRTGSLVGVEALVRWTHPVDGKISPQEFVTIAESSDLILSLGLWVMQRACRDAVEWNRHAVNAVSVSVNVSARQLRQLGFGQSVTQTLAESGLAPSLLELELTESLLMDNVAVAIDVMSQLRAAGVRLSIDDFGTGYSSLAYLQNFPLNQLKIDRGFVHSLPHAGQPIATAIISMAHSFGLTVVAEGVEYPAQLDWLIEANCDFVQGYLTGRPTDYAGILQYVRSGKKRTVGSL